MAGRTVFVIAHRLSTIRSADVILLLDAGQIRERGLHRVPSAVLRLLQDRNGSPRFDQGSHLFCLMPHDDDGLARLERRTRADNMFYKCAAPGAVQDFGETRLKPRAFSGGEEDNG